MDWLESHSPMWVHWKRKIMHFSHQGQRISLYGVRPNMKSRYKISAKKLKGLLRKGGVAQLMHLSLVPQKKSESEPPPQVQEMVDQFSDMFREPRELPPERQMDHHIVANMASYAISSSLVLVIHDNMINGTNHIV
jgi:hypothetical protein